MSPLTNDQINKAFAEAIAAGKSIAKGFTASSNPIAGAQSYNLETPAQMMYPVLAPYRNSIPRKEAGFGSQANWDAFVGIRQDLNSAGGVEEGKRGGANSHDLKRYMAAYVTLGAENFVTDEAFKRAKNWGDLLALTARQTTENAMIDQEFAILGGNASLALGTCPTPTAVKGTGGALAGGSYSVIAVALTPQGLWSVAGANNGATGQRFVGATSRVPGLVSRTNNDGTVTNFNGGSSAPSAAVAVTGVAANGTITVTIPNAVRGAAGYAIFVGAAGAEKLNTISRTTVAKITSESDAAAQLASTLTADRSQNSLIHDGLLTIAANESYGSQWVDCAGAALTPLGGRIAQIDAILASQWDLYRIQPTRIVVSGLDNQVIGAKILGQSNPNVTYMIDPTSPAAVTAGRNVGKYMSPITGDLLDIIVHPNMPAGTILLEATRAPSYAQGISNLVEIECLEDMRMYEWPKTTRRQDYGVYSQCVLKHYFPPALALITNFSAA